MAPEINVEADFEGNSRIEDGKRFVFMNLKKSFWDLANFQTMVISSRNFLPPDAKCRILNF